MSRQLDSFLPSGAVASPPAFSPGSSISPMSIPRSVPELTQPFNRQEHPQLPRSKSSYNRANRPISPPKTRSTSADESTAALIEDWRAYTAKLRSQTEGEQAHMMADRAMAEEVMNEERALWEQERAILKARIASLEAVMVKKNGHHISPPAMSSRASSSEGHGPSSAVSKAASVDGSSVPQESGRREDGTPFYAPAPRNPSRSFENPQTTGLRVDKMSAPGESPIQVTSKELTSADFGVASPDRENLETIPEGPAETIDISLIQPGLDGVSIRASAVAPAFVAKILSPQSNSPAKLSPNIRPPAREVDKDFLRPLSRDTSRERQKEKVDTLGVIRTPENQRLTMHAGHTPNHSLSQMDLKGLLTSGSATPTQVAQTHIHTASCSNFDGQVEDVIDNDEELKGQLGLTNDREKDDFFLAALTEKLENEKRKSEAGSPSSESGRNKTSDDKKSDETVEDADKDLPLLRLKPSLNFGRPMGRM